MGHQLAVRLPDDLYRRLNRLAEKTGRNKAYYLREALNAYLEDMEDLYLAEKVLDDIRNGREAVIDGRELWDGLDD
ncbi:MAG: ribbon-helix-helix protein, CopG family [Gammaproteobacteria bacterium]|nr:MAG: ribbon-helix-helix protein, CopG family [Gammaproteobacteria bacterium]